MKKQMKQDMDMEALVTRIQQQLISLENKVDTLISRSSNRPSGGEQHGGPRHDSRGPRDRERFLYKAICADCNKECEVPFKPSQDRPVYCKECFSSRKGGGSFHANRDERPEREDTSQPRPFEKYRRKPAGRVVKNKKKGRRKF